MMERKTGRIVTISSISAFKGLANSSIYATSKAAVVEYNALSGGAVASVQRDGEQPRPGDTRTGRFLGRGKVDEARLVEDGTLDRIGLVDDEVARVVEFFAGPLGQFVTGQVLRVDGGSQIWAC